VGEKEKAETFAEHLSKIFKPNPREITQKEENRRIREYSLTPFLSHISTNLFTVNEVKTVIKHLNSKKAPGYDLITNKVLQMLPETVIKYITQQLSTKYDRRTALQNQKKISN